MTFFEPASAKQIYLNDGSPTVIFALEGIILFFLSMDLLLDVGHRPSIKEIIYVDIWNPKLFTKVISIFILAIDYYISISNYPNNTLRFGRLFRTCKYLNIKLDGIFCYSKEVRRIL